MRPALTSALSAADRVEQGPGIAADNNAPLWSTTVIRAFARRETAPRGLFPGVQIDFDLVERRQMEAGLAAIANSGRD
jgi:hypothetical protein